MKQRYAIFRGLFITLADYGCLISTIMNQERILWSASGAVSAKKSGMVGTNGLC